MLNRTFLDCKMQEKTLLIPLVVLYHYMLRELDLTNNYIADLTTNVLFK